ncbi:MAG: pitrilysin family protein [Candidatus Pacearchaeota archaeon]|nr:pitrilysin family protein [Candidatus Pacearchaeota archaeon]
MAEFYKEKLKNGLTVLFEKRNASCVASSCAVKEGYSFEIQEKKGVSHFLEHLIFKGTKTRSYRQIAEEIEKKGGVLNAYTEEESTCYWNKLPSKHLNSGLTIVKDLILNPRMAEKDFIREKTVILEEIKMYHDNPNAYVLDKIKEMLYKKPFGMAGAGTYETVKNLEIKDLRNFFRKKYAVNRMMLCVVGNADFEKIKDFGMKFPSTKAGESKIKIEKINEHYIEQRQGLDQACLALGFHAVPSSSSRSYDWEIFNVILGFGMASRLFEEVREKRGLAYDIKSFIQQGKNYGYQVVYAGTTKENIKACQEIILKEYGKMKNISNREFEQAKEQLIGLRKVESEESVNVMNALINEEISGKAEEFYDYDNKISKIKLEEVKAISRQKGYSSVMLVPG